MTTAPEVRLSAADLRARFNAGRYAERADDHSDPSVVVGKELDIGRAPAWAPRGARSRMIELRDANGTVVAWAHKYCFPSGRCIPSNPRPDPKFLFEDGIRFKLEKPVVG
jgi:hypothetical protein